MTIDSFIQWIGENPELAGFAIFMVALTESLAVVGVLVPGAFIMWAIGSLIALDILPFWPVFAWSVSGAFMGDSLSYLLGRIYHQRLRQMWPFRNHPQWLDRGQNFFEKHGIKSLVFGRFVGPIRPFVPLVAGMMDMSPFKFALTNGLSALVWAPVYLLPGYLVGATLSAASPIAGRLTLLFLVVFVGVWSLVWLTLRLHEIAQENAQFMRELFRIRSLSWELRWGAWISALSMVSIAALYLLLGGIPSGNLPRSVPSLEKWWQQEWQQLPALHPGTLYTEAVAFNVQYFGELTQLQTELELTGWQPSSRPSLSNILPLLLPEPDAKQLPLFRKNYNRQKPALSYEWDNRETQQRTLFRLWPYVLNSENQGLWLGSVHQIQVQHYLYFFSLLSNSGDYDTALRQLNKLPSQYSKLQLHPQQKLAVSKLRHAWDGQVLLLQP